MKMLPFWLPLRLRRRAMRARKTKPARRARPPTTPTTIPAMAPPDKPCLESVSSEGVVPADDVGVAVTVAKVRVDVMVGRTTPTHRLSAWEL